MMSFSCFLFPKCFGKSLLIPAIELGRFCGYRSGAAGSFPNCGVAGALHRVGLTGKVSVCFFANSSVNGLLHQFGDSCDDERQVEHTGIVVGGEFDVVFGRQSGSFGEGFGAGGRNHIIVFTAIEPCGPGVESVSESERFYGAGEFADLVSVDSD